MKNQLTESEIKLGFVKILENKDTPAIVEFLDFILIILDIPQTENPKALEAAIDPEKTDREISESNIFKAIHKIVFDNTCMTYTHRMSILRKTIEKRNEAI